MHVGCESRSGRYSAVAVILYSSSTARWLRSLDGVCGQVAEQSLAASSGTSRLDHLANAAPVIVVVVRKLLSLFSTQARRPTEVRESGKIHTFGGTFIYRPRAIANITHLLTPRHPSSPSESRLHVGGGGAPPTV